MSDSDPNLGASSGDRVIIGGAGGAYDVIEPPPAPEPVAGVVEGDAGGAAPDKVADGGDPAAPTDGAGPAGGQAVPPPPRHYPTPVKIIGEGDAKPWWSEGAFAWAVSAGMHLSLIAVSAYIVVEARRHAQDNTPQIVIPSSFSDPSLTPGGADNHSALGSSSDPGQLAQNRLKDLMRTEGWTQDRGPVDVSAVIKDANKGEDPTGIWRGPGATPGSGASADNGGGGNLARYGAPGGGGGGGPKTSFYGAGGAATRIVYILDHSGSMIENFAFLQQEAERSVNNLQATQFFSVVMVSQTADVLGPNGLSRATISAKHDFANLIAGCRPEGQNDDLLAPFQDAFQRAFAMKPELIYFLTDGHFDPQLMDVVDKLNKDHKVKVNTLAFVNHESSYEGQLQEMAKRNAGVYRFVSEADLGGK